MKPIEHSVLPSTQVTDVTTFFRTITESYLRFERQSLRLIERIPGYEPCRILEECQKLSDERKSLASLDKQLMDIVELAGEEIIHESMIHEYRIAFAKANFACNNLHHKLQSLKYTLQQDQARSPRTVLS